MIESRLDVGGAVAFWTAADATDRPKLRHAFAALGLESFVPEPRPAPSVLKDALEETLGGPRVLIRPLADRDGFTVVREDRGRFGNAYLTSLVARVSCDDGVPTLSFEPYDDRATLLQAAYREHEGRVTASQLSSCLVKVVESLGGTRLRPSGAVYWVPGHKLDEWAEVAKAVERSADGKPGAVYLLRHRLDADAVRAVRDALVKKLPSHKAKLDERFVALEKDLLQLDQQLEAIVKQNPNKPVVGSHPVFQYLAHRYGLKMESVHFEPNEMPAKAFEEFGKLLKNHPAKWMIWEDTPKQEIVAKLKTMGVDSALFLTTGNAPEKGDFLSQMRQNVENLKPVFAP